MPNWKKVITSGSNAQLSSLRVDGSVTASAYSGTLYGTSSYASTASYYGEVKTFGITIDGGGSTITTGVKGDVVIPFNCTIQSWHLVSNTAGSIVIDVWKDTFANFPPTVLDTIAGTEKPTLFAQQSNSDTNLSSWTASISANDVVRFNVDSVSGISRATLMIKAVV